MKVLITYYSRTGFNKKIAKILQENLNCDIEEIIDIKDRSSMVNCLFSAFLRKNTIIKPFEKNPKEYDFVIICSPIWAGSLSPAIRTYIIQNKENFKDFALISVSKFGDKNKSLNFEIKRLINKSPSHSIMLSEKEVKNNTFNAKIEPLIQLLKQ
jgi:flavodoxin